MIKVPEIDKSKKVGPDPSPARRLSLHDFSFMESRRLLKDLHSSLRDTVIEERRGPNEFIS